MIHPQQARENLRRLIEARGTSCRSLSLALRRNPAYVHQFITRGSPERLEARDRRLLASILDADEVELGGPVREERGGDALVQVRRLDVEASAGAGAFVEDEDMLGVFGFSRGWLCKLTAARPGELSLIRVRGDSMAPHLPDGSDVLVDGSQKDAVKQEGIYVVRWDDALMIKRLSLDPSSGTLTISSDNAAYPAWTGCKPGSVAVVGRVIWCGRSYG